MGWHGTPFLLCFAGQHDMNFSPQTHAWAECQAQGMY
jgi:hypothetical protein